MIDKTIIDEISEEDLLMASLIGIFPFVDACLFRLVLERNGIDLPDETVTMNGLVERNPNFIENVSENEELRIRTNQIFGDILFGALDELKKRSVVDASLLYLKEKKDDDTSIRKCVIVANSLGYYFERYRFRCTSEERDLMDAFLDLTFPSNLSLTEIKNPVVATSEIERSVAVQNTKENTETTTIQSEEKDSVRDKNDDDDEDNDNNDSNEENYDEEVDF